MYTSPFVLLSSPEIIDNSVDLPHPLGPIMLINSPSFTSKFIQPDTSLKYFVFVRCFFSPFFHSPFLHFI